MSTDVVRPFARPDFTISVQRWRVNPGPRRQALSTVEGRRMNGRAKYPIAVAECSMSFDRLTALTVSTMLKALSTPNGRKESAGEQVICAARLGRAAVSCRSLLFSFYCSPALPAFSRVRKCWWAGVESQSCWRAGARPTTRPVASSQFHRRDEDFFCGFLRETRV